MVLPSGEGNSRSHPKVPCLQDNPPFFFSLVRSPAALLSSATPLRLGRCNGGWGELALGSRRKIESGGGPLPLHPFSLFCLRRRGRRRAQPPPPAPARR